MQKFGGFTILAGCNTDSLLVDCGQYALPNQSCEDVVFLCFSRVVSAWLGIIVVIVQLC